VASRDSLVFLLGPVIISRREKDFQMELGAANPSVFLDSASSVDSINCRLKMFGEQLHLY
jgi:hypothetical protein